MKVFLGSCVMLLTATTLWAAPSHVAPPTPVRPPGWVSDPKFGFMFELPAG